MKADGIEPSEDMQAFFERRTHEHIERVRRCLALLAVEYGEELLERARVHDASKFGHEERIPYVWLTEYHRCKGLGEPFHYPEGVEEDVERAILHHHRGNRHHPQFHDDPNDMSEVDLIEMVCDWTAMAQEKAQQKGEDGGSARGFAVEKVGKKFLFSAEKERFIFKVIEDLDSLLARG